MKTTFSRQLLFSYLFRGLSIVVSFVLTPIILTILGDERFGIWSVIISVLNWIAFFDLGIGNGLKNKLTESLVAKNFEKAKNYFSSAYAGLTGVSLSLIALGVVLTLVLNWQNIFNTGILGSELKAALLISLIFSCVNFTLSIVKNGYYAVQKVSYPGLILLLHQLLFLALILGQHYIFDYQISLVNLALYFGSSQIVVNVLFTVFFFKSWSNLMPGVSFVKKGELMEVTSLGIAFFFLQISGLVLNFTDNIVISSVFGPVAVTSYQIPFKLFSIVSILHAMLMTILWPAYTRAFAERNFDWIYKVLKRLKLLQLAIAIGVLFLIWAGPILINFWIGEEFNTSLHMLIALGTYVFLVSWNAIFIYLLNGMGHTTFNLKVSTSQAIINIPLSLMFVFWFDFGVEGVVWGTNLTLLLGAILFPIFVPGIILKQQKLVEHA